MRELRKCWERAIKIKFITKKAHKHIRFVVLKNFLNNNPNVTTPSSTTLIKTKSP